MSLRLEQSICRGARLNNKAIVGMKLNGYFLYPSGLFTLIYTTPNNTMKSTFEGVTSSDYDTEIVYNNNGTYTVAVYFKDMNKQPTRVEIDSNATRVESFNNTTSLTSMKETFPSSAIYINASEIDTTNVTDMSYLFSMCKSLPSVNLSNFNTSNVTTMKMMFYACDSLTSLDLSNFNTSNVTDMNQMFYSCDNLASLDVNNFNTVNVINMEKMFSNCTSLTSLDLSNWDVSNVTEFDSMFEGCSNLKTLDLRNWQMPSVSVTKMLYRCTALTELRLDNCNRDTLINIVNDYNYFPAHNDTDVERIIYCNETTATGMTAPRGWRFEFVSEETEEPEIPDVPEEPDVPVDRKVYEPYEFKDDTSLASTDILVNTTNTTLDNMFYNCYSLTSVNTTDWDTSSVTNMSYMFYYCLALTVLDLSMFNTSNVTNMNAMFRGCNKLTELDLSSFDTSNVTDVSYMFAYCSSLTKLDVRNFNFLSLGSQSISDSCFLSGCYALTELRLDNCNKTTISMIINNYDFPTSFDTTVDRVIYCKEENASGLTVPTGWRFEFVSDVPDEPEIPTGRKVYEPYEFKGNTTITEANPIVNTTNTTLDNMFYGCTALINVDTSDWDTSSVTDMSYMFTSCKALTELDLSNFNTSKVTNMGLMFSLCTSLTKLDLSNFDIITNITNTVGMLNGCKALVELRLDNCNNTTINKIITSSYFPTFTDGSTHIIYCKEENATGLTAPTGWTFSFESAPEPDTPVEPEEPEIPEGREVYTVGEFKNNTTITEAAPIVNSTHTSLNSMFDGCSSLVSVDTSYWDTSNVTTMAAMFASCTSLPSLSVSSFNTTNVTNMSSMFTYCTSLTILDLSSFNTTNVTNMSSMFRKSNKLTSLDLRNFDMTNVTNIYNMFQGCTALTELRLDNCSNDTIQKIITSSNFPTFTSGTHTIYCKSTNASGLTAPTGWSFSYV